MALVVDPETHYCSLAIDQKSKKKKKSKKKPAAQAVTTDTPATPTENDDTSNGPIDEDNDGEHDEQEVEEFLPSPVKEEPPDQAPPADPITPVTNGVQHLAVYHDEKEDAATRFDALVKDRDALRQEVTQLRQSLEELQAKHASDIEAVRGELADTQAEKETAEEQYQSLLGKVNTLRSQLGERLKADAVSFPLFRRKQAWLTLGSGRSSTSTHTNRRTRRTEIRSPRTLHSPLRRGRRTVSPGSRPIPIAY